MKWHEILKSYSDEIRREVYDAVIEYVASGNVIEMQPLSRMAFDFIRYDIDDRAHRREARLAKKQAKESVVGATSSVNPKKEVKSDVQKVLDSYYDRYKAPAPFKVRVGSKTVDISARRIRSLATHTVEDLIKKNSIPVGDPRFLTAIDDLLDVRCEVVRNEFERLSPSHNITEDIWTNIFNEARSQYSA
ncbi:MAG: hypothetical protein K2G09_08460 [Paramuribaculum sp.]|nr:hypothetical protein [Paramuribaculum sp.]